MNNVVWYFFMNEICFFLSLLLRLEILCSFPWLFLLSVDWAIKSTLFIFSQSDIFCVPHTHIHTHTQISFIDTIFPTNLKFLQAFYHLNTFDALLSRAEDFPLLNIFYASYLPTTHLSSLFFVSGIVYNLSVICFTVVVRHMKETEPFKPFPRKYAVGTIT